MKPTDFVIRQATVADAPLLALLNHHVHEPHLRAEPDLYRPTDVHELGDWFAQRLASPEVVGFIACADDTPHGYAMTTHARLPASPFSPARERLSLDELAVVRDWRRLGVGRLLMQAAERCAAELGLAALQLDVRAVNTEALHFYEALGYAPVQLRLERRF
jgi:ribosomal protein S18 acetylase RimI-like enzyme